MGKRIHCWPPGSVLLALACLTGLAGPAAAQGKDSAGFFPPTWGPDDRGHMFGQGAGLLYHASLQPWCLTALELYNRGWDGMIQTMLWSPTFPISGHWPDDQFPCRELVCRTLASEERWYSRIPFGLEPFLFPVPAANGNVGMWEVVSPQPGKYGIGLVTGTQMEEGVPRQYLTRVAISAPGPVAASLAVPSSPYPLEGVKSDIPLDAAPEPARAMPTREQQVYDSVAAVTETLRGLAPRAFFQRWYVTAGEAAIRLMNDCLETDTDGPIGILIYEYPDGTARGVQYTRKTRIEFPPRLSANECRPSRIYRLEDGRIIDSWPSRK